MTSRNALETSSTRSSPPLEDMRDALPTMRGWLVKHANMPDDAIVTGVAAVTKSHEDGINTYTLEVTYAG